MRLWKDERGSLVMFMVVFMPVLVVLFGVMLDVVRVKYYRSVVNEGVYCGVDSVLADYDKGLYGRYGIFGVRGKEYGLDFSSMVRNNVKGKVVELEGFSLVLEDSLSDSGVLKGQVLEDMKVRGLVNLGKGAYGIFSAMEEVSSLGFGEFGGSREEVVGGLQERVAGNVKEIKGLEERRSLGEVGLDGRIDGLYGENKSLLDMAEDLSNGGDGLDAGLEGSDGSGGIGEVFDSPAWSRLSSFLGDEGSGFEKELRSPGFVFSKAKVVGSGVRERVGLGLESLRDDLLLGEYVLERFSNFSCGVGEVERIVGNGSGVGTLFSLLLFRSFLDGAGYFCLDGKAPPELVSRLVYGVVMGLGSGVSDVVSLVGVADSRVPVVSMFGVPNPFDSFRLSYRDHLLLFSLLAGEEVLLGGIYEAVSGDFPGSYFCGARGSVSGRVSLLFLKFLPEGSKFLGGVVRGGDFVFEESVSLSFS